MARYRIMMVNKEYFPQYRFLWIWWAYHQTHQGGGSSAVQFRKLDDAVEYVHQAIAQVQEALSEKSSSVEVWSLD